MTKKRNKKFPLVTVLMNCYNADKYIYKAIKSVIDQTYKNWELIVWDDSSTDKTVEIVKLFNDKRIKFFKNKKHLGLGPSRIKAQKKIKGEYVAILDADDYSSPKRIEKQVKILRSHDNISLVCAWVKIVDESSRVRGQMKLNLNNQKLKEMLLSKNMIPHQSVMYKKKVAKKIGWYSNKLEYAQDYDLSLKLLRNHNCYIIREFLTHARLHSGSMTFTKKYKKKIIQENLIILNGAKKLYKMSNYTSRLNERSRKLNELKLLLVNKNIKNLFLILLKVITIFIQFPEMIYILIKKIFTKNFSFAYV